MHIAAHSLTAPTAKVFCMFFFCSSRRIYVYTCIIWANVCVCVGEQHCADIESHFRAINPTRLDKSLCNGLCVCTFASSAHMFAVLLRRSRIQFLRAESRVSPHFSICIVSRVVCVCVYVYNDVSATGARSVQTRSIGILINSICVPHTWVPVATHTRLPAVGWRPLEWILWLSVFFFCSWRQCKCAGIRFRARAVAMLEIT